MDEWNCNSNFFYESDIFPPAWIEYKFMICIATLWENKKKK